MPVTYFAKQHTEVAVASEAKFQRDVGQKMPTVRDVKPPLSLTLILLKAFNIARDDRKEMEKENISSHQYSKCSFYFKFISRGYPDDAKVNKQDNYHNRVNVFKPLNAHLTAALDFHSYRL